MDQLNDHVDDVARPETQPYVMTAADHYRTAAMYHASAFTVQADIGKLDAAGHRIDGERADQMYDRRMRAAELHMQLAQARMAAVQLLLQERQFQMDNYDDATLTPRLQRGIDRELTAWGKELAP